MHAYGTRAWYGERNSQTQDMESEIANKVNPIALWCAMAKGSPVTFSVASASLAAPCFRAASLLSPDKTHHWIDFIPMRQGGHALPVF